jgi:hypothetical protein
MMYAFLRVSKIGSWTSLHILKDPILLIGNVEEKF